MDWSPPPRAAPNGKRIDWTAEMDARLRAGISQRLVRNGKPARPSFDRIAVEVGGVSERSCRNRARELGLLRPDPKGRWSG
jgi:hypothetical protein